MTLEYIPLDDLTPAKLNVRKRGSRDVADLVPSIRALGLLQPLLVRAAGDAFEIIAGQRRYHALQAIAAEDRESRPVPCLVLQEGDDAQAIEASLAENVARLPMDEIDQYKAFAALVKKGMSTGDIAACFGITERLVTQRLAIANLLSPILTLYRNGDIGVQTVRLLTMATKAQQRDWLELCNSDDAYAPEGHGLKDWLFGGANIKTDVALFDLETYDGAIISDLFAEDRYFADPEPFWAAQNAAIAARREAYLADNWTAVELLETGEYFYEWEHVERSKEEGGKVFIQVTRSGEVTFHEGYLRGKAIRASERKQANKPEKPEMTAPLRNYVDLHRHAAVREKLAGAHALSFRLAVAQIIAGSELWSVDAAVQKTLKAATGESLANNKAEQRFKTQRTAIAALLDLDVDEGGSIVPCRTDSGVRRDFATIFAKLKTLSDEQVLRILSFVTAECLPEDPDLVDQLGAELDVSLTEDWQPDAAFFDLCRDKEALGAMVAEIAGADVAAQHLTATAKAQKAIITACLDGTRSPKVVDWQPRYMRFPMQGYTERSGLSTLDDLTNEDAQSDAA